MSEIYMAIDENNFEKLKECIEREDNINENIKPETIYIRNKYENINLLQFAIYKNFYNGVHNINIIKLLINNGLATKEVKYDLEWINDEIDGPVYEILNLINEYEQSKMGGKNKKNNKKKTTKRQKQKGGKTNKKRKHKKSLKRN